MLEFFIYFYDTLFLIKERWPDLFRSGCLLLFTRSEYGWWRSGEIGLFCGHGNY